MSRAQGRKMPRTVTVDPDSREGHGLGMSDRMTGDRSPIPGGRNHIVNAPTIHQRVPVPESRPEITDLNAHGVPPDSHTARERAEFERGPNVVTRTRPEPERARPPRPEPVPVFIVEEGSPRNVRRTAAPRAVTVPASTGDALRIAGVDSTRVKLLLLNESQSSDIRFAQRLSDLNNGGGALLPWPNNSYLRLETQDEVWVISADSGTPRLSIISEHEQSW